MSEEYMVMYDEEMVLCGASAYAQKFYLNEDFSTLPESIKQELQIMCVMFTEDVGGIINLVFEEDGTLQIKTQADPEDILYDEIGSVLKVKQIQRERKELFESLETFYKVFVLGGE